MGGCMSTDQRGQFRNRRLRLPGAGEMQGQKDRAAAEIRFLRWEY